MNANEHENAARKGSCDGKMEGGAVPPSTSPSDDGSLRSLWMQGKCRQRRFHCRSVSLHELVGRQIWLCDYASDVRTRFGEGRTVVLCKNSLGDPAEKWFKFITASSEIAEIMQMIEECNAFPRLATVCNEGNMFWLE